MKEHREIDDPGAARKMVLCPYSAGMIIDMVEFEAPVSVKTHHVWLVAHIRIQALFFCLFLDTGYSSLVTFCIG